jgi:hypothetical protein
MPSTAQSQDSGLVQRGLLLLCGMAALAVIVLLIALRQPESAPQSEPKRTLVLPLFNPAAGFPATADWAALVQVGQDLPSAPGWEIRYNAAAALARRGSSKTPWPIIREMLDLDRQRRNFRVTLQKGEEVANAEEAQRTVQSALAAVDQWHKKQDAAALASIPHDLQQVYDQIARLGQGPDIVLRVHAERVRQAIARN